MTSIWFAKQKWLSTLCVWPSQLLFSCSDSYKMVDHNNQKSTNLQTCLRIILYLLQADVFLIWFNQSLSSFVHPNKRPKPVLFNSRKTRWTRHGGRHGQFSLFLRCAPCLDACTCCQPILLKRTPLNFALPCPALLHLASCMQIIPDMPGMKWD